MTTSGGVGTDVGSYIHTASGTDENYTLSFVDGSLSITQAALTITANADGKTYDGLAYSGGNGVAYSGFVNGETSAVLGGTLGYEGTSQGAVNAGSYVITPNGLTSGNYAISFSNGTLTVDKASATVTANSDTQIYSGVEQSVTGFTATGLWNVGFWSAGTPARFKKCTDTSASPAGSYLQKHRGLRISFLHMKMNAPWNRWKSWLATGLLVIREPQPD